MLASIYNNQAELDGVIVIISAVAPAVGPLQVVEAYTLELEVLDSA